MKVKETTSWCFSFTATDSISSVRLIVQNIKNLSFKDIFTKGIYFIVKCLDRLDFSPKVSLIYLTKLL